VAQACVVAATWLGEPLHTRDIKDASQLRSRLDMQNACWMGQADACLQVAASFGGGRDAFPRDLGLAAVFYGRGCDLGEARACSVLGVAFAYGDGVPADPSRATAMFERSCHLGYPLGCANLGSMLEVGEGIARDRPRARALYRDACVTGEVYGCLHAEMMAAADRGAPANPRAALSFWRHACDAQRDARACAFVGLLYEDGPDGVPRDEGQSEKAMQHACDLGHHRACEWMKYHSEE
jgi:TPR repeat protein